MSIEALTMVLETIEVSVFILSVAWILKSIFSP